MDGYAISLGNLTASQFLPQTLNIIGDSAAGHPFKGRVASGQAVRIFTGGFMPLGSDTIIIEENTKTTGGQVTILESSPKGRYIRKMGQDFKKGDCLIKSGECLSGRQLALLAAAGHDHVHCRRKPKIAIISTGDELAAIGTQPPEGGIIASNGIFLKHLVEYFGGEAMEFDLVGDKPDELAKVLEEAADADLIVSSGGASASEHDGVARYINNNGGLAFWRIAMRPGKPLIFGHVGGKDGVKSTPLLGLPGNPVSTGVCGLVFVGAALNAMLGRNPMPQTVAAKITTPLKANDQRQDFLRANITHDDNGQRFAAAYDAQDSAMMKIFAQANGLIIRPPHAPALAIGDCVPVLAIPPQI